MKKKAVRIPVIQMKNVRDHLVEQPLVVRPVDTLRPMNPLPWWMRWRRI